MSDQEELIVRFLDHSLSDQQLAEMGELLNDSALVDSLLLTSCVDDLLRGDAESAHGKTQARGLVELLGGTVTETRPCLLAAARSQQRRPGGRPVRVSIAAATAIVVLLVGLAEFRPLRFGQHREGAHGARLPVATISRSVNVEWPARSHRWSVGDKLREGDSLDVPAGRVELVFDLGAVMTLVGPAMLEIRSGKEVLLRRGTATTRVESVEGDEFQVLTPSAHVVDLGTEFGVRVEHDGNTDVVVFDGEVDVRTLRSETGAGAPGRRLKVGEAVRADESGRWQRLISIDNRDFPFGDAIFNVGNNRPPVILGVTDDHHSPERPKCYRIYHASLGEEARAFVDRTFEWNGTTEDGLPGFLRGADYVATFNHDKDVTCPLISVQLSGPAWMYLFYDDRMLVPNWLAETFEDTGTDIGLDEGKWSATKSPDAVAPNKRILGVGPGRSIDRSCSIWRRRIEQAGTVQLGPIGDQRFPSKVPGALKSDRTMFGIAAQPLRTEAGRTRNP